MIIVTGAAGFIGSHLVKGLNQKGISNLLVVDDLSDGRKFKNLVECKFIDYLDKEAFREKIIQGHFSSSIQAIFHQGACSTTTEWNGRYLLDNNYEYSKILLHYSVEKKIPFYYASSAAIYGKSETCKELPQYEKPLNMYGYSKLLFDQYVRQYLPKAKNQIVGLRYFNVYGRNESHKGSMMSVIQHFYTELCNENRIKIFCNIPNCEKGEQRRDFIYVDDVVAVNLWFLEHRDQSGIFNLGSGRSESFNNIANTIISHHGEGWIQYEPIPSHLQDYYQTFTEADLTNLRKTGCDLKFKKFSDAIPEYITKKNLATV